MSRHLPYGPYRLTDLSEQYPDIVRRLEAAIEEVRTEPELERFENPY